MTVSSPSRIALHEAGHVVVAVRLPGLSERLHSVSVVPDARTLGRVWLAAPHAEAFPDTGGEDVPAYPPAVARAVAALELSGNAAEAVSSGNYAMTADPEFHRARLVLERAYPLSIAGSVLADVWRDVCAFLRHPVPWAGVLALAQHLDTHGEADRYKAVEIVHRAMTAAAGQPPTVRTSQPLEVPA